MGNRRLPQQALSVKELSESRIGGKKDTSEKHSAVAARLGGREASFKRLEAPGPLQNARPA